MERNTIEKPTITFVNSGDELPIERLENLYPERWLLIQVTREDKAKVREGKLIALADDPMELIEPRRNYRQRGIATLTTQGVPREPDFMPIAWL